MKKDGSLDITRLVRGEKEAWDFFVDRYAGVIYGAVRNVARTYGRGRSEDDVADIVQDVFMRLVKDDFRLLKSYRPAKASLITWLTIVARSVAIDFLKRRRLPCEPLDANVESTAPAPVPAASGIELPPGLLSPREKLVLRLLFDEEWGTSEVAGLLGIAVQSVRNHKHRALKRLRKFLKKKEGRDVRARSLV